MRRQFLWVAVVLLAITASAVPSKITLKQNSGSVDQFDFVEIGIAVEKPDAKNPFTDVTVTADVTAPNGQQMRVDGFCDSEDGSIYRARYMPFQAGKYKYQVIYRQADFESKQEGAFTARKGKHAGLVRVDPDHPFHFLREGSRQHWFWNGTTTYQILSWDDETIAQSVDRLGKLGVNRLRVAICGRTRDGARWNEPLVRHNDKFKFKMEPWLAARPDNVEDPGYDVTRFNLEFFRKAERMLRLTRDRDMQVSIIFYVDGRDKGVDPFHKEGMGGADEQRYYRYVIARLGAFENVMWDVANEYRLFRTDPWAERMGAFVKQCDPYAHLTSVHGHEDFHFRKSVWADFALYQSWDELGGYGFMLKNRREQAASGRAMPQINEEYGYEDHYPTGWGGAKVWPARNGDSRRRLAWEMAMAGCYQTTGERANDGTGAGADTGGGWVNGRGDEQMTMLLGYKRMMDFFMGIPWWTMEPRDDLANENTMLLADRGRIYVAYIKGSDVRTLKFKLAEGRYTAKWYNPRTGGWTVLPEIHQSADSDWKSPETLDAGDWALLVEKK